MALAPINPTNLTPPRVALIDERSGAISREWYRFFLSLLTATETNQQETGTAPDANALMATYDAMLASLAQETQTNTSDLSASLQQQINDVFTATAITPPPSGGTVTSVDASGGSTGLLFTGGPITTSGTLTLSGTLVAVNGGTGFSSYTVGDILFASSTTALSKLADVATGNALISGGVGVAPLYGKIGLTTHVSGTLAVGNGGTGATTLTANGVLLGNGTSAVSATAVGATGEVLVGNTGAAPTWAALSSNAVTSFSAGTTGLTPSTATTGAITLAGTLNVANGGTGTATAFTAGSVVFAGVSGTYTQNNAQLFWDNANNRLGVGNATPAATLDVTGNIRMSGANPNIELNSGGPQVYVPAANTLAFATGGGIGAPVERMRINSSGNVGVGTTSPVTRLEVKGTGFVAASISGDSTNETQLRFNTNTAARVSQQANQALLFDTNATERMRIDASGNVGIGTTAPGTMLQVNGDITTAAGGNVADAGGAIQFRIAALSTYSPMSQIKGLLTNSAGTELQGGIGFSTRPLGAAGQVMTERMRITSAGNVGIGTSSPGAKLDVVGSGSVYVRARSTDTTGGTIGYVGAEFAGGSVLQMRAGSGYTYLLSTGASDPLLIGTAGTERMRITSAGNVGIGTTSPGVALDVAGTIRSVRNNAEVRITTATGYGWRTGTTSTASTLGYMYFQGTTDNFATSFIDSMAIDSTGKVGIGTTSPAYKLQLNVSSGANQVAYFVNDSAGSSLSGVAVSINSGGNNTSSYHFAGVTQTVALWYLYGNGTTSYTSDIRVKKNVTTTRDGYLEDVCKLRVVKYNWYNDSDDTPRELGFIAQEVEQVFPGLVQDAMHPTKDGEIHKVLKGSVLMPIMLKALQEANAKIDALTARVTQLEGN